MTGTDALRATAIDGLALLLALGIAPALRSACGGIGLALVALAPALAVAWAWSVGPWAGLHPAADVVQLLVAAGRLAPWLAVIAILLPDPVPAPALHAVRLAGGRAGPLWRWQLAGPGRRWLCAALACWGLALGEFEVASRLAVDAWAVRLFDAQAGGLPLPMTLALALPGAGCALAVLGAALVIAPRRGDSAGAPHSGGGRRLLAWILLSALLATLVVWPLLRVLLAARGELSGLAGGLSPALASALVGGIAAALAWISAGWLGRRWALALAIPGCLGGLALGLTVAAGAQIWPELLATPLPWVLTLTALLLPPALLLRHLAAPDAATAHAAELLRTDPARRAAYRELRWRLVGRPAWLACTALSVLACWELPASALLHPTAMTPLPAQLYNLMHYGESPALAARIGLALLAPLLPTAVFALAFRRLP